MQPLNVNDTQILLTEINVGAQGVLPMVNATVDVIYRGGLECDQNYMIEGQTMGDPRRAESGP